MRSVPSVSKRAARPRRLRVSAALAGCAILTLGCAGGPTPASAPASQSGGPAAVPAGPAAAGAVAADAVLFPATNRPDVRGIHGAVSSDHPLATAAGYEVLKGGGNAVDAIIAMAGVLAVVRPHMNGVGGDAFAIFYDGASGRVTALNGSGRAGALATPDFFARAGRTTVPSSGALSVTVPGAVAAWSDALERFGTRRLGDLLKPAIEYARDGFPVSVRLQDDIRAQGGSLNPAGRAQYFPNGAPPPAGTRLANPALARTLEAIAAGGKDAFYRGAPAERIAAFVRAQGGYLSPADFAAHRSEWVDPISLEYMGHRFLAMPPNTQGVAQLQQMEMSKSFNYKEMGFNSERYLHTVFELAKLSSADAERLIGDPAHVEVPVQAMLDPGYLRRRAGLVGERAQADVSPGMGQPLPAGSVEVQANDLGDTVYLTAVDQWGNAVSWIQSLYSGFGSGLLEPETGVMLHNRGALFVLTEGHPNQIAPGRRPYHTLSPLMALHTDGKLAFTLGTPGGDGQTQTLLQVINGLLVFGMTPQEAIEAPRYRVGNGLQVQIEDRIPNGVRSALAARGHTLSVVRGWTATFGGAQMIFVDARSRTITAAADPRREAYAIAY